MQRWISPTQAKTSSKHLKIWRQPKIKDGKLSRWNWLVVGSKNLTMGRFTDIGAFTFINAINGVTLEDEVQIGPHCSIMSASTIDNKWGPIILKKKCCIGAHSTVMPNVTVGENTIVGAHSFVNKNIPANVIAFGVPVRVWKKLNSSK